jgi:hypothetical protein
VRREVLYNILVGCGIHMKLFKIYLNEACRKLQYVNVFLTHFLFKMVWNMEPLYLHCFWTSLQYMLSGRFKKTGKGWIQWRASAPIWTLVKYGEKVVKESHLAHDRDKWRKLVNTVMFHKRRGISWLAEWLLASQEKLCSMGWVSEWLS